MILLGNRLLFKVFNIEGISRAVLVVCDFFLLDIDLNLVIYDKKWTFCATGRKARRVARWFSSQLSRYSSEAVSDVDPQQVFFVNTHL